MLSNKLLEVYKKDIMIDEVKPDKSREVKLLFTIIASSVLLFLIFSFVWVIKRVKEGVS
tara:strand:- start:3640 stop:3816 length:177 start_codon:yes stop_codon:yes gene_type:complete